MGLVSAAAAAAAAGAPTTVVAGSVAAVGRWPVFLCFVALGHFLVEFKMCANVDVYCVGVRVRIRAKV